MRLLQGLFTLLWGIGYLGNCILFIYIEWTYLRQNWIQILNPFLHLQVLGNLLTAPLFWIFLAMAVLGYYIVTATEQQIDKSKKLSKNKAKKIAPVSPPPEPNIQPGTPSSPPTLGEAADTYTSTQLFSEQTNQLDDAFIRQQVELLEWAIQSSQKVQFGYENRYGAKSDRTVTPIGFKTVEQTLCLGGYCHLRRAKRTFAIKRMTRIRLVSPNEISHQPQSSPQSLATETLRKDIQTLERPYIKCHTDELERTADSQWNSLEVLSNIHHELGFRSRKKAHVLRERISQRLTQLEGTQFAWPTTTASSGSQNLSSDAFKYEEGLLRHYGYKVGMHGLPQSERWKILDCIFLQSLKSIDNPTYLNEWGKPKTAIRLQKLAESIAAFTRNAKRRNMTSLSQAIQDWEADLVYLKKTYYNNHFSFKWPRT